MKTNENTEKKDTKRKKDRRTIYTQNAIKDALLTIMTKKEFEQITITELCKEAEITRATYYMHYSSLTDVLNELLADALNLVDNGETDHTADINQVLYMIADKSADQLAENESLLPICHRVSQLPKYNILFRDESISTYVMNKLFLYQKDHMTPVLMQSLHLPKAEAEMLTLFLINGTYSVNKALGWQKNKKWFSIHHMLLKFTAGGYDNLKL